MADHRSPTRPAVAPPDARGLTFAPAVAAPADAADATLGGTEYHFAPWDDAGPLFDEHARVVIGATTQFYNGPVEFAGSGKWGWVAGAKR